MASQNFITRPGSQFVQSGTGAVERTVTEKLQDVVSVKDFGAIGDGVADDTAAIQAAIDYVESRQWPGGVVYFPPCAAGVFTYYRISAPLTITKSHVALVGDGAEGTSILTTDPSHTLLTAIGASFTGLAHLRLENLSFGRTVAPNPAAVSLGIYLENTVWASLINVKVLNCKTCFKQVDCTASS